MSFINHTKFDLFVCRLKIQSLKSILVSHSVLNYVGTYDIFIDSIVNVGNFKTSLINMCIITIKKF